MTIEQHGGVPAAVAGRPVRRIVVAVVVLALAALLAFATWASRQGYVSWFGEACTDQGFVGPPPSYDELTGKFGLSPFCAREIRGETWF